jgi:hypothetical protein
LPGLADVEGTATEDLVEVISSTSVSGTHVTSSDFGNLVTSRTGVDDCSPALDVPLLGNSGRTGFAGEAMKPGGTGTLLYRMKGREIDEGTSLIG